MFYEDLEQIKLKVSEEFNLLRERYGNLLIRFYKEKINVGDWNGFIIKDFDKEEISFMFGINIKEHIKNNHDLEIDNIEIDLGKESKFLLKENSSRLLISPDKAAVLTWICTDGYLDIGRRGYYITIRDEEEGLLYYFIKLIKKVYGELHTRISKIKNKNAYEAVICSKKIVLDVLTYIPLSSTKEWSFPVQFLDDEGIKSALRILTQTEGCIFETNRLRMIEITLVNLEALTQAKYFFEKLGIPTKNIREDYSGGWLRYKLGISTKNNLERFKEIIGFIPDSKKHNKFKKIMGEYKEYHKVNCGEMIMNIIKNNPNLATKDIIKLGKLDRSTVSRNLKKLRHIEKIDYKKGRGNLRLWFVKY